MLKLYDYLPSQNAYKIRLLLNHLSMPYETQLIQIFGGEGRTAEFCSISPSGTVPAIELGDGSVLAESNAILMYLAEDTAYLPPDRLVRAKIAQWLMFEAEVVQTGIATLRHWVQTGKDQNRSAELLEQKTELSIKSLSILERHLGQQQFLAGSDYSVADMSIFAYVHLAAEANLPLEQYPSVVQWISRIRMQPGFLAKTWPYSIDPRSYKEL